jgi:hypothetical protein
MLPTACLWLRLNVPLLLMCLQGEMGDEFVEHLQALAGKLEYVARDDTACFSAAYRWGGAGQGRAGAAVALMHSLRSRPPPSESCSCLIVGTWRLSWRG